MMGECKNLTLKPRTSVLGRQNTKKILSMKSFISSDKSTIKYRVVGSGKPIVFIHGWGVDHKLWFNKIESIEGQWKANYQRIYFDLPGMGKSIASESVRTSDDVKRNIEELLNITVENNHYLLAGESYGGYLSRGLLIDHKNDIDGIFLLCPLVFPGSRKGRVAPKIVLERDYQFLNTLHLADRNEFEYLSIVQTKQMWEEYKNEIDLSVIPENNGFLEKRLDGSFSRDINNIELQYDKPALILTGRQDTEVGFEDQYHLYKDFKRATIQILDKAGHNLQIERNSLFQASFLDWIERIETFGSAT